VWNSTRSNSFHQHVDVVRGRGRETVPRLFVARGASLMHRRMHTLRDHALLNRLLPCLWRQAIHSRSTAWGIGIGVCTIFDTFGAGAVDDPCQLIARRVRATGQQVIKLLTLPSRIVRAGGRSAATWCRASAKPAGHAEIRITEGTPCSIYDTHSQPFRVRGTRSCAPVVTGRVRAAPLYAKLLIQGVVPIEQPNCPD
jgi:hypothetical protein